jgi:predicted RNA-binding protein YlqC (UPF0109 family)
MPPKKSTKTSTSPSTPNLDAKQFSNVNNIKLIKTLEKMTKSIENMSKVQQEFNSNYELLTNYGEEELNELDYQIKLKNEECYNSLQEITKSYNEKKFQLENDYKEREYALEQSHQQRINELEMEFTKREFDIARTTVERDGFTVILTRDYEELNTKVDKLTTERETFEKTTETNMHKELNARLKTQELQHQVASSDMKAKIENQGREIESLRTTIETLKQEIQAQRELTREVAQAGQKAVTQNFGGK